MKGNAADGARSGTSVGYDPGDYWGSLVSGDSGNELDQVGWEDMGRAFNKLAYRVRARAFSLAVARVLEKARDPAVFEAGFGVGFYLEFWRRRRVRRLVGIDLSRAVVDNCSRRYPEFDLRQGDITGLEMMDDIGLMRASFDIVTAIDVIYHILDETEARRAAASLASLVAPGGNLLVSDKFVSGPAPMPEASHVVRRPLSWYDQVASVYGLRRQTTIPVFWCMDSPLPAQGRAWPGLVQRILWMAQRAAIKPWRRNSAPQTIMGSILGSVGLVADCLVVPRSRDTHNLTIAVYARD